MRVKNGFFSCLMWCSCKELVHVNPQIKGRLESGGRRTGALKLILEGTGIFLLPDSWFNQDLSFQPSILILWRGSLMSSCWTNMNGLHLFLFRHLNALTAVCGENNRCSVQLSPMNPASPSPADSTCSGMCSGRSHTPKKTFTECTTTAWQL